ncbi:MAG: hypothetical protein K2O29_04695 [Ruminococcus sp.]|nr:hypothetical protein [Ruminococcus sp.]MDE7137740.1 hypothetical protein [Ruminococcus sp.]
MKVAGGLLMAIGAILAVLTILFQNDTGKSSPLTVCVGIVLLVAGIVVFNVKPKDKKD